MQQPRAVVFGSYLPSLINFRRQLLIDLQSKGYAVVAMAPDNDEDTIKELTKLGVKFIQVPLSRNGFNPISDLRALRALKRIFYSLNPKLLVTYTIKPNIYGTMACTNLETKKLAWITGLGFVGMPPSNFSHKLIRKVIFSLYRKSMKKLEFIAFQNPDDKLFFQKFKLLTSTTKQTITAGSGVDFSIYNKSEAIMFPVRFMLIARLIKSKGVNEYLDAAEILKKKYADKVFFDLIGMIDANSHDSISEVRISELNKKEIITYYGEQKDIRPYLAAASVFVLPSYYREGVPRTILEAMAMGKPIITTDNPGCRETVKEGENGFIIPIKNANALIMAMEKFIKDSSLIKTMGNKSYDIGIEKYDVHKVNKHLLSFIEA